MSLCINFKLVLKDFHKMSFCENKFSGLPKNFNTRKTRFRSVQHLYPIEGSTPITLATRVFMNWKELKLHNLFLWLKLENKI